MAEISFTFDSPLQAETFCVFLDDLEIDYKQNQCIVTINDTDDCDEVCEAVNGCGGTTISADEEDDKNDEDEKSEDD